MVTHKFAVIAGEMLCFIKQTALIVYNTFIRGLEHLKPLLQANIKLYWSKLPCTSQGAELSKRICKVAKLFNRIWKAHHMHQERNVSRSAT